MFLPDCAHKNLTCNVQAYSRATMADNFPFTNNFVSLSAIYINPRQVTILNQQHTIFIRITLQDHPNRILSRLSFCPNWKLKKKEILHVEKVGSTMFTFCMVCQVFVCLFVFLKFSSIGIFLRCQYVMRVERSSDMALWLHQDWDSMLAMKLESRLSKARLA